MKTICNACAILILSWNTFGQKEVVYQKTFSSEEVTTFTLNSVNTYLQVKASDDDKIHINLYLDFFNYKDDEIANILNGIDADMMERGEDYIFTISSDTKLGRVIYEINSDFGLFLDNSTFESGDGTSRRFRKTKEELLRLVTNTEQQEKMLLMLKKYNESGEVEEIDLEKEKSFKVSFVIEVPSDIELKINSKESDIHLLNTIEQPLLLLAKKSNITAKGFNHPSTKVSLKDGTFKSTFIKNGRYHFDGVNNVIIAEIADSVIESEFSTVSIGEMTSPIKITDYNSEYWFYDLIPSKEKYLFTGEYSKFNIYYPTDNSDYKIETIGFNTAHYLENLRTDIPPNKENRKTKMLLLKKKDSEEPQSVNLEIDIIHGVVRLGKDFIEVR